MRQSFIASRAPLEDNAHVMMQFKGGAVGTLWASAVNAGAMHQQKIRIVGSKASIEWWDEQPNQLRYEIQGEAPRILERGMDYLYQDASGVAANRVGGGHGLHRHRCTTTHHHGAHLEPIGRSSLRERTQLHDQPVMGWFK